MQKINNIHFKIFNTIHLCNIKLSRIRLNLKIYVWYSKPASQPEALPPKIRVLSLLWESNARGTDGHTCILEQYHSFTFGFYEEQIYDRMDDENLKKYP